MGVAICCGNGGMAKEILYDAKIGAPLKQVGGKGVAEGVRRNIFFYFCRGGILFNKLPKSLSSKPPAPRAEKKIM